MLETKYIMLPVIYRIFRRPQPPPATVAMVAGGGGLVSNVHVLFMPLVTDLDLHLAIGTY